MNLSESMQKLSLHESDIPSIEEMQRGYLDNIARKQKQCEYQKRYMDKKKTKVQQLAEDNKKLSDQNHKLLSYHSLFELLRLQNPQLADQLINQLNQDNVTMPPATISSPVAYSTMFSSNWPHVSMQ